MIRQLFSFLFFSSCCHFALALPARVMIIRHAEKKPFSDSDHLSPQGFRRAEALKNLFNIHPEYATPRIPDRLFAARHIPGESSLRSVETLTPMAASLGLILQDKWSAARSSEFGRELLNNPDFDRNVILIAWKHSAITKITRELKAPCSSVWNSNTYDRIWLIDFIDGKITCKDVPQSVLQGDSTHGLIF